MFKKLILAFSISLFIGIIISPLRGGYLNFSEFNGIQLASIVGYIFYFIFTYYLLIKNKEKYNANYLLIAIITGMLIFVLPIMIYSFHKTKSTYLQDCIHLLGIFSGFICFKTKNKKIFSLISLSLALLLSIPGNDYWLNKITFGTYTGKVQTKTISPEVIFQTSEGENIYLTDFSGKYLVIDCWHSYCGICYKEMPKVQSLYEKYMNEDTITFYALHCRFEKNEAETYKRGTQILKERGFTIPCLSINIEDEILKDWEVKYYPTVLIFDKESNLIFRGDSKHAEKFLKNIKITFFNSLHEFHS